MQGVISRSMNVMPRTRGWLKGVAAILALASGLAAGLVAPVASAADPAFPVVRFYNERTGTHFYTIETSDADYIKATWPWFAYEGVQFYAYKTAVPGSQPVYRFFNTATSTHFYTIVAAERDYVIQHFPTFLYEGAVYYAMLSPSAGSKDLYRFYNTKTAAHFYTTVVADRDYVKATWPWFSYEGVAYQVFGSATPDNGGGGGGGPGATTTALISTANPAAVGASVSFVATVSGNAPTGSMTFTDNGAAMAGCGAVPVSPSGATATAVCTTSTLTVGGHTIMATYAGDAANASSSNSLLETITGGGGGVATSTSLSGSPNPSTAGSMVVFTASVTGNSPTGTISFTDSGASIGCAAVPLSAGMATCSTSALAQGTHSIIASYGGDAGNMGSSGIVSQVVNAGGGGKTATMTTLVSSANPAASGASVTFTATVTGAAPTGSVNFLDGTGSISNCAVVALAAGSGNSRTAACATTTLSVATHSITARYSGDAANLTSTSSAISETITGTPPAVVPTVAFTLSNTLIVAPQTVTINAVATETGGTISKVSLYLNGAKLIDLTASPYTFTTAALGVGTHQIYATATDAKGTVASTLTQNVVAISGPPPVVTTAADADIWRLLNQATFGASQAEAAKVKALGIAPWIDSQFTQPVSGYPDTKYNVISLKSIPSVCTTQDPAGKNYPSNSPQAICARDHLTLAMLQRDFFVNAVTAPDQLRQRVAWALSQIAVTSGNEQDLSYAHAMSRYQNIMFQEAFGNYQTLLSKITLSPAMGNYLDMVNNDRGSGSRVANENYAREIMQLFSVGLEELNDDGSVMTDMAGNPIPTYDQNTIKEFAKVFTGYTFADPANPTAPATKKNAAYYVANMVTYPTTATSGHETSAKTLLNGVPVPPNQTPQQDLDAAVQNVFMHPNTPAYIGRQLIQRLVTGNPSPAYIARISAVFKDNGQGVRGDMKAVVKAILLDQEARDPTPDPTFGSLREPVLAVTAAIRALNGITDGNRLAGAAGNLGQNPYFSPTVFNYFPPDATIPGTSTLAPEFAIHTTNSAVARSNLLYTLVYSPYTPDVTIPNAVGTRLDLSQFAALANNPAAMVARFNDVLMGGQLDPAAATIVENAVNQVVLSATPTAAQLLARAQMGAFLILSSFHFQVQR